MSSLRPEWKFLLQSNQIHSYSVNLIPFGMYWWRKLRGEHSPHRPLHVTYEIGTNMVKDEPYFEGCCHCDAFCTSPTKLSFDSHPLQSCLAFEFPPFTSWCLPLLPQQGSPEWSWATTRCTPSPAAWPSPSAGRTMACQWSASWTTQRSKTSRPRSTWRFSVSEERNFHYAAFPSPPTIYFFPKHLISP